MPEAGHAVSLPSFLYQSVFPGGQETAFPQGAGDGSGLLQLLRSEIASTAKMCNVDVELVNGMIERAVEHLLRPDDGRSLGLDLRLGGPRPATQSGRRVRATGRMALTQGQSGMRRLVTL